MPCLPRFRERAHSPQPSVLEAATDIIKFGHGVQAVHKTALGVLYWEISDGQHVVRVTDGNAIRFAEALARSEHVNIVDQKTHGAGTVQHN